MTVVRHLARVPNCSSAVGLKPHAAAYGASLMAQRAFRPGDVVARLDDAVPAPQGPSTVQIGPGRHVRSEALEHLNHSCRPNVAVDTTARTVTATRAIAAGEMLTSFYPSTEWQLEAPFVCQCGEPECLRFVAGARFLSPDVLSRYSVNKHIVEAIVATLSISAPRALRSGS